MAKFLNKYIESFKKARRLQIYNKYTTNIQQISHSSVEDSTNFSVYSKTVIHHTYWNKYRVTSNYNASHISKTPCSIL